MKKVFKIVKTLKKGILILWRDYKFIVPLVIWHKYYLRLCQKIDLLIWGCVAYNPDNMQDYHKWIHKHENKKYSAKKSTGILYLVYVSEVYKNFLEECILSITKVKDEKDAILVMYDSCNVSKTIVNFKSSDVDFCDINNFKSEIELKQNNYENFWFLCANDILSAFAHPIIIKTLEKEEYDLVYFDFDTLNSNGQRVNPVFKNDYSPEVIFGYNYIGSNFILKKSIIENNKISFQYNELGFYNLVLQVSGISQNIKHISEICFHKHSVDIESSNILQRVELIDKCIQRRNLNAKVKIIEDFTYVDYAHQNTTVSIIIPAKDHAQVTERCLNSILNKTSYQFFEIILVDNGSTDASTHKMYEKFQKYNNFKLLNYNKPFNYSAINNFAIGHANGEVIVLLNNDTEIISPDWLESLVGYAIQEHIGAVGARLLYEDDTIQHGGIVLGVGGIAVHTFLHKPNTYEDKSGRLTIPYNYSAVTAACLAIEKKKLINVGMLNEDLQVAYNDVDLNLKLLEQGLYNVFHPYVQLYHLESKSRGSDTTSKKYKLFLKESKYMKRKWMNYIKNDSFYNKNLSRYSSENCFNLKKLK